MLRIIIAVAGMAVLASCASTADRPAAVERLYVINCGENHVKDVSRWTPGVNVGKPHVFGNHCYLVRHARGWMLWDTGNEDRIAALPNGLTAQSGRTIDAMKAYVGQTGAQLWVNHDLEQHARLPKAPAYVQ